MKRRKKKPRLDAGEPVIYRWADLSCKLVKILKGLVDIYRMISALL